MREKKLMHTLFDLFTLQRMNGEFSAGLRTFWRSSLEGKVKDYARVHICFSRLRFMQGKVCLFLPVQLGGGAMGKT